MSTLSGPIDSPRHRLRRSPGRAITAARFLAVVVFAAVGLFGAYRYIYQYWLYRGFPAPKEAQSVIRVTTRGKVVVHVAKGNYEEISVKSPALGGEAVAALIYLPAGYTSHPTTRYPTMYLLHGRPGDPSQFEDVGNIGAIEDELVAEKKMQPMILVMPGSQSFLAPDTEWANGIGKHSAWESFVATDLVNAIDHRYRTIASSDARVLAGLSEGGYGALNIGFHHPGLYSLLESWSGYPVAINIASIFGHQPVLLAYNSPIAYLPKAAPALRAAKTFVWFYCGNQDYDVVGNENLAAEMKADGVPHTFFLSDGGHDWALWRAYIPDALITASAHVAHV